MLICHFATFSLTPGCSTLLSQSLCQDLGDVDPAKKQELHITIDGKAGADSPL